MAYGVCLPVPTLKGLTAMQMGPIALRISHPIFSPSAKHPVAAPPRPLDTVEELGTEAPG